MKKLFEPFELKGKEIKNRIVFPPMMTGSATKNGTPTPESLEMYEAYAKSGVGLVILEHHSPRIDGFLHPRQYGLHDDKFIDEHKPLREIFKNAGVVALVQINHSGAYSDITRSGDEFPLAPSSVSMPHTYTIPKMMSIKECQDMQEAYVKAVERAVKIGYDGVEIHSCHGFLLGQFLSPITNKRDDIYGGDTKGRTKLLRDIIKEVREKFPHIILSTRVRISDNPKINPPINELNDNVWLAKELKSLGVDIISVSGNLCGHAMPWSNPWGPYSKAMQEAVGELPVLNACNIRSPEFAQELLDDGTCSLIGVGRPILRYPDYLQSWIR